MSAIYLVRFDDICPTMNWPVWEQVESILVEQGIAPILAVVPDNRDPKLQAGPADERFWDRVRDWQARGWTIGMHGYQHAFVTADPGLLGIQARSEFAGLSYDQQFGKLQAGLEIFRRENVKPQVWVAPAHSFDGETLRALAKLGIQLISDGFATAPYRDIHALTWVPQQFWRFRSMPFGVWTVCYHVNPWTDRRLKRFASEVLRFRPRIGDFQSVVAAFSSRRENFGDSAYAVLHRTALKLKRRINMLSQPSSS